MSQIIETVSLSKDQAQTVLKNLYECQHVRNVKTKFASLYEVYVGELDNDEKMIYIVFYDNKFDKQHYYACEWFYHLFENDVKKKSIKRIWRRITTYARYAGS